MAEKKTELVKIVGKENVLDAPAALEAYCRDNSFAHPIKPYLVVKPRTGDEVHQIVQWAKRTSTPLVPVSSGPPHFNGDTVPSVPEAVIVDLSGMKKVLNINRRNRTAVIEPGVTYGQLQSALAKEGLRLSTSLLPRGNKSVLASVLEREPRLNPRYQWTCMEPLRCLEIVWGDGNRLMTGDAAGGVPDLKKQWEQGKFQIVGTGPMQLDFYRIISGAQGSMGIANWASVKCELLPQTHKMFLVAAKQPDDLIDFTYRLLKIRYADEIFIMNSSGLASVLGRNTKQISALMDELPSWVVVVGITGTGLMPEERVEYQEKDISEIAQQFGLRLVPSVPGASGVQVLEAILNPPKEPWKLAYKGGCQHIFFVTTLDKTTGFVETMYSIADSLGYPSSDIGVYLQPLQQGVSCHCEFDIPYDPNDPKEVARIKELYEKASRALLNQGAYYSRPYGIWADMQLNRDAQGTKVLRKVKDIFDPDNVMNPGKLCL